MTRVPAAPVAADAAAADDAAGLVRGNDCGYGIGYRGADGTKITVRREEGE